MDNKELKNYKFTSSSNTASLTVCFLYENSLMSINGKQPKPSVRKLTNPMWIRNTTTGLNERGTFLKIST